jgi:predicted acyltransferase
MAVQGRLLDFNLSSLHIFANTLQAIAVGYFIAAVIMLNVGVSGQIVFAAVMMIGYWLLLMYIPLAGHGAGSLEPRANVAFAVDQYVRGRFIDGTNPPYTWVLSGLTFSATVLLGVFSGHILRSRWSDWGKLAALTFLGMLCLGAGWVWAKWLGFPIIKHIWTSSMVLWAGGWSFLLVALFYLLIDVLGLRRWAFPFVVVGMNAIAIYVAWKFIPFPTIAQNLVGVAATARKPGVGLAGHAGAAGPFLVAFSAVAIWRLIHSHFPRRKNLLRI